MDSGYTALHTSWSPNPACAGRMVEPLTDRERHFVDCLAKGASNKEIARMLQVSENTVKFHLKNVYSKFAVKTRAEAVRAAVELGLLNSADVDATMPGRPS